MEGGEASQPEADNEAPVADVQVVAQTRAVPHAGGWEINWPGVAGVVAVGIILLLVWSQLGGDDAGDVAIGNDGAPQTSVATTPGEITRVATTTTTVLPTTSVVTTTTLPERRVVATGEIKPCRFSDRCIAVSFVIEGFETHPGNFTCIYPNSTSNFGFGDNDVIDACLSGDAGDTITIDVDGVKSAAISEANLDGTG